MLKGFAQAKPLQALRADKAHSATIPTSRPQKAAPTPAILRPERVTRKVNKAASRWPSSFMAVERLDAMVLTKANPATANTMALGKAASKLTTEAPAKPKRM